MHVNACVSYHTMLVFPAPQGPYDDRESMIVDASAHVEQTEARGYTEARFGERGVEAPALASFGAFRPSRRMKA